MKKLIKVGNTDVILATNGATPLFYKQDFQQDFFRDITKISDTNGFDFNILYNLFYEFAKCGNKDILPFVEFFAQFENFAINDYSVELVELALSCIGTQNQSKNAAAAGSL